MVVVLASGPSAAQAALALQKARRRFRVLAVNESFRLAPCDGLYGCDGAWWKVSAGAGFAGLKISQDETALRRVPELRKVTVRRGCDRILVERPGEIGDGGNSGFQAINLAAQFGARRIVLAGFDMRLDRGVHWHGRHPAGLNNPRDDNLVRWRKAIDGAAATLAALGIEAINASHVSTLVNYPKRPIEECLR